MIQVFLIHYFAGHGLRDYIWIFNTAVPTFLLISAFLYGLRRNDEMPLERNFILKRFKTLAVVYYPFIISVFLYYAITDTANIGKYSVSLVGELLFLCNFVEFLPLCGHLWFMQSLMFCYVTLWIITNIRSNFISKLFINPQTSILLFAIVVVCGFAYRGGDLVYAFFYLWIYFNAKKINVAKINVMWVIICLFIGYCIFSLHYENIIKGGGVSISI
jgi:hypothetical protein